MSESNGKAKVREIHTTLEAAKAATGGENERVIAVAKDGAVVGYVWATNANRALLAVVRQQGFSARVAEHKDGGPLTTERLAAKLAELSDEQLAEMGLSRKRGKK
jgi:hypothetical protein